MGWDYGRNTGPKGDIDTWLDTLASDADARDQLMQRTLAGALNQGATV